VLVVGRRGSGAECAGIPGDVDGMLLQRGE